MKSLDLVQRTADLFSKEPDRNILGFEGHVTAVIIIQFCHCRAKAMCIQMSMAVLQ